MRLLVIRLSAMGDVALAVPVLKAVLRQYPKCNITLLTRPAFVPMFQNMERLHCIEAEVKNKHKGLNGLYRLYREVKKQNKPDKVIDLHDVMRSWVLCALFKKDGIPFYRIDKGRSEKKALTRKKNKQFVQLKHSVTRYLETFLTAGFPAELSEQDLGFEAASMPTEFLMAHQLLPKEGCWIGIAPFAKHQAKIWPFEKMKVVIQALKSKGYQLFFFGGGQEEIASLGQLTQECSGSIVVAGRLPLTKELGLIKQLDLMITMDSANMHLAAISGIPVVSIWGPTHPYAGFAPLNGNEKYIVQLPHEELPCRPSSVFGNKPCFRGDHACMERIGPSRVITLVEQIIQQRKSERK